MTITNPENVHACAAAFLITSGHSLRYFPHFKVSVHVYFCTNVCVCICLVYVYVYVYVGVFVEKKGRAPKLYSQVES